MELTVARNAGFCFGVEKAVNAVYEAAGHKNRIYTYGPIIHNETVVEDLKHRGVGVIHSLEEVDRLAAEAAESGEKITIVIRSHGVSRDVMSHIQESGLAIIDTTCPFVSRIHQLVEDASKRGSQIVIIGNAGHPEVVGTMGWSHEPASVIGTTEEAENWDGDLSRPVLVVAQTTFNTDKFQELVAILQRRAYNIAVVNTICNATRMRQQEARRVAAQSDVMIVIGGKSSSNSAKLYEICRKECHDTYFIQTVRDLPERDFSTLRVGITAGASTPKKYHRGGSKLCPNRPKRILNKC